MHAIQQNARTEWFPAPRESLTYATSQGVPGPAASSASCRASVFRRTRVQNFKLEAQCFASDYADWCRKAVEEAKLAAASAMIT